MLPMTLCGGNGVVMSSGPPTFLWKSDCCVQVWPFTVTDGPGGWAPRPPRACPAYDDAATSPTSSATTATFMTPPDAPARVAARIARGLSKTGKAVRLTGSEHGLMSDEEEVTNAI